MGFEEVDEVWCRLLAEAPLCPHHLRCGFRIDAAGAELRNVGKRKPEPLRDPVVKLECEFASGECRVASADGGLAQRTEARCLVGDLFEVVAFKEGDGESQYLGEAGKRPWAGFSIARLVGDDDAWRKPGKLGDAFFRVAAPSASKCQS